MEKVIEIDLIDLVKKEISINEFLTMVKIDKNSQGEDIPFYTTDNTLDSLENKNFIKYVNDMIYLTSKGKKLFMPNVINFDDLYDLYPYKTPNGRMLRAKSKEVLGSPTRDYKLLSKKYNSLIKNVQTHELVIKATKNMLDNYKAKGSLNYLAKLETYINQRTWEQFVDVEEINQGGNVEKL